MVVDCIIKLNQGYCLTSENYVVIQIRLKDKGTPLRNPI